MPLNSPSGNSAGILLHHLPPESFKGVNLQTSSRQSFFFTPKRELFVWGLQPVRYFYTAAHWIYWDPESLGGDEIREETYPHGGNTRYSDHGLTFVQCDTTDPANRPGKH